MSFDGGGQGAAIQQRGHASAATRSSMAKGAKVASP
jgi:hypothetical protein